MFSSNSDREWRGKGEGIAYRKISGNTKDWLPAWNFRYLLRRNARCTQRPVGVPEKEPSTRTDEGRPVEPEITTRTRQVPATR